MSRGQLQMCPLRVPNVSSKIHVQTLLTFDLKGIFSIGFALKQCVENNSLMVCIKDKFEVVTIPSQVIRYNIRGLQICVWVWLFNSILQASIFVFIYPSCPIRYPRCQDPAWKARTLEMSLFWNLKIILAFNLVLIVQSKGLNSYKYFFPDFERKVVDLAFN